MSSNRLSATFPSFPSDQSVHAAPLAAAGPNPLSLSLDAAGEQRRDVEGRTEERRRERKVRQERERAARGHAERSCLMRTLDPLQIDREVGTTQPK